MDDRTKPRRGKALRLAYDSRRKPKWKREEAALPGRLFDATVVGLFLFLFLGLALSSVLPS